MRCGSSQTLGLTVGIRLVESIGAIGREPFFRECLEYGVASMTTLDCVQKQLERISQHGCLPHLKIMRCTTKNCEYLNSIRFSLRQRNEEVPENSRVYFQATIGVKVAIKDASQIN